MDNVEPGNRRWNYGRRRQREAAPFPFCRGDPTSPVPYAFLVGIAFAVFLLGCAAPGRDSRPKAPSDFTWGEEYATPGVRLSLRETSRERPGYSTHVNYEIVTEGFPTARTATDMNKAGPQVLITMTACFRRLARIYEGMAYRAIVMNIGAIMQTMYMVATAMDLAPCAIGKGDSRLFAEAAGLDGLVEDAVGEFALSSR